MDKRYSQKPVAAFIKFDFKKNMSEAYYRKNIRLKPLKTIKTYKILYKNIKLYEIKTKGKTYRNGSVTCEFSKNYVSPPFKLYFSIKNHKEKAGIYVNTFYNKVALR
jgi:hypothetical protein